MSLVINSNAAATAASNYLNANNALFQRSLGRLSSGYKIQGPSDDAGGLAVSMKMQAAIRRTDALITNVANAMSLLQTQDGAMDSASRIVSRISELCALSGDSTKSASDIANYNTEFTALQAQLTGLVSQTFNGVALFVAGGATKTVITSENGTQSFNITIADLAAAIADITAAPNLAATSISTYTAALQSIATDRANNGSESNRLEFASEVLMTNRTNLEAANSRIIDTDIAVESTKFARYNILVQSGSAMLAQANSSSKNVLRLLV
jgi:flagellin